MIGEQPANGPYIPAQLELVASQTQRRRILDLHTLDLLHI